MDHSFHCILLLQHPSTHMHFITNGYEHFSKTDPRQRVPLIFHKMFRTAELPVNTPQNVFVAIPKSSFATQS